MSKHQSALTNKGPQKGVVPLHSPSSKRAISTKSKPFDEPVYVTRPFLPSLDEFVDGLHELWENQWLTNDGPIVRKFASELSGYYETDNVCLFNNGTLALQIGLQAMGISGEVITTPFTFVATTHALYWNKIRPVFVDIEPEYFTLDPEKVEAAITPWTTAILAVHVFGHPCRVDALADIARRHKLRLIYDAAHAFGVRNGGKPLAHYGDMSMYSFHATKLFHSIEGGMLTFDDSSLKRTIDYLKNFGFENEVEVVMPGTNAKMNEVQALMGSAILSRVSDIIARRSQIIALYRAELEGIPGVGLVPEFSEEIEYNYAYMPVEIDESEFGMSRDQLYEELKEYNIYARRYFYPLICDMACYKNISGKDSLSVAKRVSSEILTLPIYYDLSFEAVERICEIVSEIHNENKR